MEKIDKTGLWLTKNDLQRLDSLAIRYKKTRSKVVTDLIMADYDKEILFEQCEMEYIENEKFGAFDEFKDM